VAIVANRLLGCVLVLATLTGCPLLAGDGWLLALSSARLDVSVGGVAEVEVTLVCEHLPAPLALVVVGTPAGVSWDIAPTVLACGEVGIVTLTLAPWVAAGEYHLEIGTAADPLQRPKLLLVVHANSTGSFTLTLQPSSLTLPQGGYGEVEVTVVRSEASTTPVSLSAAVVPDAQHIHWTFDAPQTVLTSTLGVAIGLNVPARAYTVTVQGYSGSNVASATLLLTVNSGTP
jgi:hypothetical protein